jgi:hypothetical protein
LQRKIRVEELGEGGMEFKNEVVVNDYGIDVGEI